MWQSLVSQCNIGLVKMALPRRVLGRVEQVLRVIVLGVAAMSWTTVLAADTHLPGDVQLPSPFPTLQQRRFVPFVFHLGLPMQDFGESCYPVLISSNAELAMFSQLWKLVLHRAQLHLTELLCVPKHTLVTGYLRSCLEAPSASSPPADPPAPAPRSLCMASFLSSVPGLHVFLFSGGD